MGVAPELCARYGRGCVAMVLQPLLRILLLSLTVPLPIPDGHHRGGAKGDSSIYHCRVLVLSWSLLYYLWPMVGVAMVGHCNKHHPRVVVRVDGCLAWVRVQLLWLGVRHVWLA